MPDFLTDPYDDQERLPEPSPGLLSEDDPNNGVPAPAEQTEAGQADADMAEGDPVDDEAVPAEVMATENGAVADGAAVDTAVAAPVDENPSMRWYIIHTYSGFERKVAESLQTRSQAFGFSHKIGQVLMPKEEVVELRNGKKVTSERLLYPGYVMVQMDMDDELWHQVKDTPKVTGFVGGGTTPVPMTADEVNKILHRQANPAERPRPKLTFEKNETVRITDGPFANFSGKIDDVNLERNTLRVLVTIFGRTTPVELDFFQVEKV